MATAGSTAHMHASGNGASVHAAVTDRTTARHSSMMLGLDSVNARVWPLRNANTAGAVVTTSAGGNATTAAPTLEMVATLSCHFVESMPSSDTPSGANASTAAGSGASGSPVV